MFYKTKRGIDSIKAGEVNFKSYDGPGKRIWTLNLRWPRKTHVDVNFKMAQAVILWLGMLHRDVINFFYISGRGRIYSALYNFNLTLISHTCGTSVIIKFLIMCL